MLLNAIRNPESSCSIHSKQGNGGCSYSLAKSSIYFYTHRVFVDIPHCIQTAIAIDMIQFCSVKKKTFLFLSKEYNLFITIYHS